MFDFIADLDAYFCKLYASYDKICMLKGYQMPKRQTSEVRNGKTYAYTLPKENLSLDYQENKTEMLAELKEKLLDKSFSFTCSTVHKSVLFELNRLRKSFYLFHTFSKSLQIGTNN